MAAFLQVRQTILALLLLPLTWAVSFMSLQPIQIADPNCLAQYNTTIAVCSLSDFFSGDGCSIDCIANLNQVQTNVVQACQSLRNATNDNTLLGAVFQGLVVGNLCSNVKTLETITATVTVTSGAVTPSVLRMSREEVSASSTDLDIGTSTLTASRLPSGATDLVTDTGRPPTPRSYGLTRSSMVSASGSEDTSFSTDELSTSPTDSDIDIVTETAILTRTVFPTSSSSSPTVTSQATMTRAVGGAPFNASSGAHTSSSFGWQTTLIMTVTMMLSLPFSY